MSGDRWVSAKVALGDLSGSDEPTSVLKILDDFKKSTVTHRRLSNLASVSQAAKRKKTSQVSKQFNFSQESDDTLNTTHSPLMASTRKVPRLAPMGPDPLENLSVIHAAHLNRLNPPVNEEQERLKAEVKKLQGLLLEREAEHVNDQARIAKWESHGQKMELTLKKERLEAEAREAKLVKEKDRMKEEKLELTNQVAILKKKARFSKELENTNASKVRDDTNRLEDERLRLLEVQNELEIELAELKAAKANEEFEQRQKIEGLELQLKQKISELEEAKILHEQAESASGSSAILRKRLFEAETELREAKLEVDNLKSELQKNEDAVVQRQAMRERLDKFPKLQRENESLRMENQLLSGKLDNEELLKEKVISLKSQLEQAQGIASNAQRSVGELQTTKALLRKWEKFCWDTLTPEERNTVGESVGPEIMQQKVANFQRQEILLRDDMERYKSKAGQYERCQLAFNDFKAKSERDTNVLRNDLTEQGKLLKRFQRKIALVAKERDSYRSILDSCEKEYTFTSEQFDTVRSTAMEDIIKAQKDTIEKLENEMIALKASGHGSDGSETGSASDLEDLRNQLSSMKEARDRLQDELDRRALRGDYNPADTQVLHMRMNPTSIAIEQRQKEFATVQEENEGLKARIKLLEEGQTKDLTLLVGHKMEEGASSKEVQDLKNEIQSQEVKRQRILEAFKKTSHDFRNICCQLTGFQIDGLPNDQYRLTPTYAESREDYLLFQKTQDGECMMLETPFSQNPTIVELMDLHLSRQNSIPMFLAAIITDLFSKQTFEATGHAEEEEDEQMPEHQGHYGHQGGHYEQQGQYGYEAHHQDDDEVEREAETEDEQEQEGEEEESERSYSEEEEDDRSRSHSESEEEQRQPYNDEAGDSDEPICIDSD